MKRSETQTGVAILIALGVLAVIMALTMFFVSYISITKSSAQNTNELTTARMVIASAIQRVKAGMSIYAGSTVENYYDVTSLCNISNDQLVTTDIGSDSVGELLATIKNEITYYTTDEFDNTIENSKPQWQYIKDKNGKIINRVSFVIIADTGRINPSIFVDSGANAFDNNINAVSENENLNPFAVSIDTNGDTVYGRSGINSNEINLNPIITELVETVHVEEYLGKMSSNLSLTGEMPSDPAYSWYDLDYFFEKLNIDKNIKNFFSKQFSFIQQPAPEAFWIAGDEADTTRNENEMFNRFNLRRTDWDSLTVNDIISTPTQFSTTLQQDNGTGIPWLSNWKNKGNFTDKETRAKQIAANLIDYNDTNSSATTDDENAPTYVGVEKVPYINEIKIDFTGETREGQWDFNLFMLNFSGPTYTCLIKAVPHVELINIYNSPSDTKLNLSFSYKYQWHFQIWWSFDILFWHIEDSTTFTNNTENNISTDIFISSNPKSYAVGSASELDISPPDNTIPVLSELENAFGYKSYVTNFQISNVNAKLTDVNEDFYDYSYIVDATQIPTSGLTLLDEDTPHGYIGKLSFHSSISDPRQNLNSTDWDNWIFQRESQPANYTYEARNVNSNPNPGGNTDQEDGVIEPWDISTVYVRNAPMESPWELGAIHRGAAWQTLNLKKYNNENNANLGGGSNYSDGDANILDQIKMTQSTYSPGKVNINNPRKTVLEALLYGVIQKGDEYDSMPYDIYDMQNPSTIIIEKTQAAANAESIFTELSNTNLKTRSELLNNLEIVATLTGNTGQSTDAEKESIIGKIINITDIADAPAEIVNLIIVAQSIQDIGSVNGSSYGNYDHGIDRITATQKAIATIQKDSITNKFKIVKFEYINN
jgi:hypothetical protein